MDFIKPHNQKHPKVIKDGDLIVIYIRHDSLDHLYAKKGQILNNKFGSFHHDDIIGRPFGSKISSKSSSGWIYVVEPTPELWSIAMHTRTQIVNEVDSSIITLLLDVHPGCRVVESGTGSGCMSLCLARAVHPTGQVFTFEFNHVRAQKAIEEFKRLGVDHLITVQHHDVCGKYLNSNEAGFIGVEENSVDAVFLDLPEPWLAIEHAHKILKPGKSVCCYSPCIEQVIQSQQKLRVLNFHSIRMIEIRQRPFDGRVVELETLDLGLNDEERIENEKSTRDPHLQHYNHQPKPKPADLCTTSHLQSAEGLTPSKKRKLNNQSGHGTEKHNATVLVARKECEVEDQPEEENESFVGETFEDNADHSQTLHPVLSNRIRNRPQSSVNGTYHMHSGRPVFSMKGHTAFLTFAIKSCT